jgi:hypothetical protein
MVKVKGGDATRLCPFREAGQKLLTSVIVKAFKRERSSLLVPNTTGLLENMKRNTILQVIGVLGFIATLGGVTSFLTGKNLPDFFKNSHSSQALAADQVRICMQQHGLSESRAVLNSTVNVDQISENGTIYAECTWPLQSYSGADGYSEIRLITQDGPGLSEVEGLTQVDRFFAPCHQVKISYSFGNQGNYQHLAPFVVKEDTIVTAEGNPWQGEMQSLDFYPERGEIDIVRNLSYTLDQVECIP